MLLIVKGIWATGYSSLALLETNLSGIYIGAEIRSSSTEVLSKQVVLILVGFLHWVSDEFSLFECSALWVRPYCACAAVEEDGNHQQRHQRRVYEPPAAGKPHHRLSHMNILPNLTFSSGKEDSVLKALTFLCGRKFVSFLGILDFDTMTVLALSLSLSLSFQTFAFPSRQSYSKSRSKTPIVTKSGFISIRLGAMHSPVVVLNDSLNRESGSRVHHANIQASKAVADIIRTTLGPRSMLKMLLDASGGIVVTNDGNAILRELDLAHPAAKSMIELSRTQDEEVGDGTTSVIVLAGEMLHVAEAFIDKRFHPTVICRAYSKALEDAIAVLDKIAMPIDVNDRVTMMELVKSCIGTKFTSQFGDLIADLALDATTTIGVDIGQGLREVDIKKYIKVEKVPGGQLEDSKVLKGVMFNKDVVAPGKMRRKIINPRIILLDCPLEYKKGENQTNAELVREEDWAVLLKMEEEYIESICMQILKFKPDLVITEKGLSDLACHYFSKAGVSAIRRLRKTDNNRIAKACGATIVNRPDELQESDVGTGAGLFEVKKIGDEFFAFVDNCKDPKACTVLLRGASKDLLNEVERNLQDAMSVARNILKNPKLLPGGGATELTVSATLKQKSQSIEGIEKWPYEAAAIAFEAIPRTLAQNCGVNVIRTMTALQGKHANGENSWIGIDGNTGAISDMRERKIWDAYNVKAQTFKTAIEAASMLLRIDDIVSGIKKKQAPGSTPSKPTIEQEGEADNEQMIPE